MGLRESPSLLYPRREPHLTHIILISIHQKGNFITTQILICNNNMASSIPSLLPPCTSHQNSNSELTKISQNLITKSNVTTSRRTVTLASVGTILLATREAIFNTERAYGFDFRITVPDQTLEEAESEIRSHAQDLLDVKEFIELESWKEAQKQLRKSSSLLKQDIYTIIQTKPGEQRPLLRKLYSQLFNNVTSLDYAARSKDEKLVKEYYDNIVVSLDAILSKMYS